jgi:hypothetical protein
LEWRWGGCDNGNSSSDDDNEDTRAAGLYVGAATTPVTIAAPFTLAKALTWLANNAAANTDYTIVLGDNENLAATTLGSAAMNNATGVSITLRGKDEERTIQLTGTGSLFTISSGITLILDQGITLKGVGANTAPLVAVNDVGTLEMRDGAKITGNTSSTYGGGGVSNTDGTFTMNGGEISGNSDTLGGGGVDNYGIFTMSGGKISGNSATLGSGGVSNGTSFTMEGGKIFGNTGYDAGGVYMSAGTFTMSGGEISGNTATGTGGYRWYGGGGVHIWSSSTFTKTGGVIYGDTNTTHTAGSMENTAASGNGHAVRVSTGGYTYKKRNSTAGETVNLDSATTANWE